MRNALNRDRGVHHEAGYGVINIGQAVEFLDFIAGRGIQLFHLSPSIRRKGLDNQIADLQSQYESVEQEDERSGALDMNLISQKLDEWQRASKNDVDRELINSCVAQITPLTNEEFRWVLDFQMSEVQARNAAAYTMDGFVEMARFSISFEEAKAFKASRNQGIRKNEWQDLTVVVGIWSKTQK